MEAVQDSQTLDAQPMKIARSWRRERASETTRVQCAEGFGFGDFLDFINPLQHIPIVGTLYRAVTGDEIRPEIQLAGDLAYGLATGSVLLSGATSIASLAYEQAKGEEPTVQIAQSLFGDEMVQPAQEEAGYVQMAQRETVGEAPEAYAGDVSYSETATARATPQPQLAATLDPEGTDQKLALFTQKPAEKKPNLEIAQPVRAGHTIYADEMKPLPPQRAGKLEAADPVANLTKTADPLLDSQILGHMIHEQAKNKQAGNELPPELVRDMMLMALDKYKTAQSATATDFAIP